MNRALVIDPDPSEQRRLIQIITSIWPAVTAGAAATLKDGYAKVSQMMPGILVTDFYLRDGSGLELLEHVRRLHPEAPCVLLTRHDDTPHILAALKRGVDGYILKDQSDGGIKTLLRGVAKGEPGLSPEITRQILRQFETSTDPLANGQAASTAKAEAVGLTHREIEVLSLLSLGRDRHQVGETLNIRPSTVAGHIKSIYLKLDVSTRAEATLAAVKLGLVPLEP